MMGLRIVEIGADYGTGGIGRAISHLVEEFRRLGHEAYHLCMRYLPGQKSFPYTDSLRFSLRIVPEIQKVKPDIVHVHNSFPLPAAFLPNVVFTLWDPPLQKPFPLFRVIFKRAKKIVLLTPWGKEKIPREDVEIIPGGVNDKVFCPTGKRKNLGLSILCVGVKAPELLIKAHNQLAKRFPSLKLIFVGPANRETIEHLLALSARPRLVTFLGPLWSEEILAEYYRGATIYASSTQYEGFGLPFLEAMACGKAVVAFRKAAIPYVVRDGETGLLADTLTEFVEKIAILLEDRKYRLRLERKAAEMAKEYAWTRVAQKYIEVFKSVVGGTT